MIGRIRRVLLLWGTVWRVEVLLEVLLLLILSLFMLLLMLTLHVDLYHLPILPLLLPLCIAMMPVHLDSGRVGRMRLGSAGTTWYKKVCKPIESQWLILANLGYNE